MRENRYPGIYFACGDVPAKLRLPEYTVIPSNTALDGPAYSVDPRVAGVELYATRLAALDHSQ